MPDLGQYAGVLAAGASALILLLGLSWRRVPPVVALTLAALWLGVLGGLPLAAAALALRRGFGEAMGGTGLVLAFGAMLGAVIAADDGVGRLAMRLGATRNGLGLIGLTALVGLPMFFESGVLLMLPIVFAVARTRSADGGASPGRDAVMATALPVLATLSVLHAFTPPHPGPVAAITLLQADLGRTFLLGLLLAPLGAFVGGWIVPRTTARRVRAAPPAAVLDSLGSGSGAAPPGAPGRTLLLLLAAPLLIGTGALLRVGLPQASAAADVLTDPVLVLLAVLLLALVSAPPPARAGLPGHLAAAIGAVAPVLLVIGAGGALKQVMIDGGFTTALGALSRSLSLSPAVTGWVVAAIMRNATGSATLATLTAAGVMAPAAATLPAMDRSLLVLAVGAGSVFFSHVNDAGFWQVKTYLGLGLGDTFRSWSIMEAAISVTGLLGVLILGLLP